MWLLKGRMEKSASTNARLYYDIVYIMPMISGLSETYFTIENELGLLLSLSIAFIDPTWCHAPNANK